MKKNANFGGPSPDDMYTDDEGSEEPPPPAKVSSSRTGKSTRTRKGDSESAREELHSKEKQMQDRIHSLELEVIKLQLENSQLSITRPGIGKFSCFQVL